MSYFLKASSGLGTDPLPFAAQTASAGSSSFAHLPVDCPFGEEVSGWTGLCAPKPPPGCTFPSIPIPGGGCTTVPEVAESTVTTGQILAGLAVLTVACVLLVATFGPEAAVIGLQHRARFEDGDPDRPLTGLGDWQ